MSRLLIIILGLQLILQTTLPAQVLAQAVEGGGSTPTPINLDLSSTDRSIAASSYSGLTSAVIQVGGSARTVTGTDFLTAAESIALQQVLASGQQSLLLGDQGHAIGGSFNLSSGIGASMLSGLVVPTGVTAIHDFGLVSNLNLTGNFNNAGNFYAISSNSAVTAANISALNILNQAGGLLSSVLPAGGLSGYSNLVGALSLNLMAINDIINSGSIMSSANLSAVAGGSIINSSLAGQNMAIMQAAQNLNLQAMNIANSGLLAAQLGNMNIATQQLANNALMQSLNGNINILNSFNPAGGLALTQSNTAVMEALNGAINFSVVAPLLKASMNINGGSLLAQELNFNNGDGTLNVNLRDAAGAINVNTGIASFAVTNGTHGLNIQSFNITGDPNLVYSGSGAFSSGAFNSDGGYVDIDTTSDTTNGSITFTGTINTTPTAVGKGGWVRLRAGTFIATQDITTVGNNEAGGDIVLDARTNLTVGDIDSSGASGFGAGRVYLGSGTGGAGNIQAGDITAGDLGADSAGTFSALDVYSSGTFYIISEGDMNISGFSGTGRNISLISNAGNITVSATGINVSSSIPGAGGGAIILSAPNGDISVTGPIDASGTNGAGSVPISIAANNFSIQDNVGLGLLGNISTYNDTLQASTVQIFAKGNITARDISTNSAVSYGHFIEISAGNSGTGNISLQNINSRGSVTAGNVWIVTPGTLTVGNILSNSTSNGNGGYVYLSAGTSGTSRAPAQSGLLSTGNINSSAGAIPGLTTGNITIINMGTNGAVSTGTLTATATGNGSVSYGVAVVAHGTITTGAINTTSSGSGGTSGTIFLSSGGASGTVVTTGTITSGGPGANQNAVWIVRNAGTSTSLGTVTSDTLFNGAPSSPIANIVGTTTIRVRSGSVIGYNPGGFDSINAPAGTITFDTRNVAIPRIPIVVRGGNVSLASFISDNDNTDHGVAWINAAGNISITSSVSSVNTLVSVQAISTAGTISLPGITGLNTGLIRIIASQGFSLANGASLQANSNGVGGLIWITSPNGSINLGTANNQTSNSLSVTGSSGGSIYLTSWGDITSYSVSLVATGTAGNGGGMQFLSLAGNITLYNLYATALPNYNANINVNSSTAVAGYVSIRSIGNFSVLRDTSVCCGGTNTMFISANGVTGGGAIGVYSPAGNIDLSNLATYSATGANGNLSLRSHGGNIAVNAQTTTAATVSVNSLDYGSTVTLAGNITAATTLIIDSKYADVIYSSGTLTTGVFTLSTSFASLGTAGSPIVISATSISPSARANGAIYVSETNGVTLNAANSSFGTFNLRSGGVITVGGANVWNNLTLNSTVASTINVNANLTAVSNITIGTTGLVIANGVTVTSNMTSGTGITINSNSLASALTITAPGTGGAATFSTAGAGISIAPTAGQTLTFASSSGAATLNLNGGPVTVTSSALTTVNASVTVASNNTINMNVGGTNFTNNGTVRTSQAGGSITVQGTSGFGLAGSGGYSFTGGGATSLIVQLNGAGTLSFSSDTTLSPGEPGSLVFNAQNAAGIISLGANVDITAGGGADLVINTSSLVFGNNSSLVASGNGTITTNSGGANPLTITSPDGGSATMTTGGGAINVAATAGQNLIFAKSAGAGTTTLNLNGAPLGLTITAPGTITVNAGVTLQSDNNITVTSNGVAFTNNGIVRSIASGGSVLLQGSNGFTLAGSGSYETTGGGSTSITVQLNGAGTLNLNSDLTFNPGNAGTLNLNAQNASGSIALGANTDILATGGANLVVSSPNLQFGNTSSIAADGDGTITINSGGSQPLTITAPDGSSALVVTAGGSINITPTASQDLTFTKSAGAGTTTLNLNGGSVFIIASGNTLIAAGASVVSNNVITFSQNGGSFVNNGTLKSNTTGTPGTVNLQSTGNLMVGNLGLVSADQSGVGNGGIVNISANSGTLTLQSGLISASASGGGNASGGSINISAQTLVLSGGAVNLSADAVGTGNGGVISVTTVGANDIVVGLGALNLSATGGSGGSVSGNGGSVTLSAGRNLLVNPANINVSPAGNNGNGGGITLSAGTVASGTLQLTGALNVNGAGTGNGGTISVTYNDNSNPLIVGATGSNSFISGAITANAPGSGSGGSVSITNSAAAALNIQLSAAISANSSSGSFGTITLNKVGQAIIVAGSSSLTGIVSSSGLSISLDPQAASSVLTLGTITSTAGFVSISATGSGSSISLISGASLSASGGAVGFYSQSISIGNLASVSTNLNSGIGIQLLSPGSLTITSPNNSSTTFTTSGANIIVSAAYTQSLTFAKSAGAQATTINLNTNGGTSTISTNGGATLAINASVNLASNGNLGFNIHGGGTFTVNGSVNSSMASANITVYAHDANLTMNGSPAAFSANGGGQSLILIQSSGANTLNIASSYSLNAGGSGSVVVVSGTVNLASGATLTSAGASALTIGSDNLILGAGATVNSTETSGTALYVTSAVSGQTAITAPNNSTASILSAGGDVVMAPRGLTFAKSVGANSTTLNITGGALKVNTGSNTTTINSSVTVSTDNDIDMLVNWGTGGFINNGVLTTSKSAATINITGYGMSAAGSGTISATGGGASTINFISYGDNFNITGNYILNAGANGTVNIMSASGNISLGDGASLASSNGSQLRIQATAFTFGNNAGISTTKSTGTGIDLFAPTGYALSITTQTGGSASLATNGGAINISSGGGMTLAQSASGISTLNLGDSDSGNVTINSWNASTTINNGVTLRSQSNLSINVNQAVIGNNGEVRTTAGNLTMVASTGNVSIGANAVVYANEGNLVIQNTNAGSGSITVGAGTLLEGYTLGTPGLGNVTIVVGEIPVTPVVGSTPSNVTVNSVAGGEVYFGVNGIQASAPNNTINAIARIVVFSTGTQGASAIQLGGNVTITADPPVGNEVVVMSSSYQLAGGIGLANGMLLPAIGSLQAASVNPTNLAQPVIGLNQSAISWFESSSLPVNSSVNFSINPSVNPLVSQPVNSSFSGGEPTESGDDESALLPISFNRQSAGSIAGTLAPDTGGQDTQDADDAVSTTKAFPVFSNASYTIKPNANSNLVIGKSGSLSLKYGEALIQSKDITVLRCKDIIVELNAGTIMLINKAGSITKIYNLCEDGAGSIKVTIDGRCIELSAGHEVVIGSDHPAILKSLDNDGIGRRNIKHTKIPHSYSVLRSEVSLLTLMNQNNSILTHLIKNPSGADLNLRGKLVKMAACLMTVTAAHGPYSGKH